MQTRVSRVSFHLLLLLLMAGCTIIFRPFLLPALLAFLIAVICRRVNLLLRKWLGGRRRVAALLATVLVCCAVLVPLGCIVTVAAVNAVDAIQTVTSQLEAGKVAQALDAATRWIQFRVQWLTGTQIDSFDLRGRMMEYLSAAGSFAYQYSPRVFTATANITGGLVLVVVFVYLFFAEGSGLYDAVLALVPLEPAHKAVLAREIGSVITATFAGLIATALVQGLLIGIGFWIAGIENAFMWGVLAIGLTLLPLVGAPVMYVPAATALLIRGNLLPGLFLLVYGIAVVSTVDNIIKPLAMRDRVNVHPVLLALSLIGGGLWLGMTGIIIGPMVIALTLAMLRIYRSEFTPGNA